MKILVIDVGGTNVKVLASGQQTPIKIPSGSRMTPRAMVKAVLEATATWTYDAVSIGYPGPVTTGKPARDPWNLGRGMGRVRLQESVQAPGSHHQRRRDAGARQLRGRQHALSRARHRPRVGDGPRRCVDPARARASPVPHGKTYEEYLGEAGYKRSASASGASTSRT